MAEDIRAKCFRFLEILEGRQAMARKSVVVDNALADEAGLEYRGSDIYETVVRVLKRNGAIEMDEETAGYTRGISGGVEAFRITPRGRELLRKYRTQR